MMAHVEEDGDEIFTKISDGCLACRQPGQPNTALVKRQISDKCGSLYWVCPHCNGFYGKVQETN